MISIETDGDISYNTLRRFYGIIQGTSPSEKTLNILSKYVGFKSYKDFCFNYPQKKNWAINQKIYIFGIAMNKSERQEVINEANKIYDVKEVYPSIYLATELSRSKL